MDVELLNEIMRVLEIMIEPRKILEDIVCSRHLIMKNVLSDESSPLKNLISRDLGLTNIRIFLLLADLVETISPSMTSHQITAIRNVDYIYIYYIYIYIIYIV